ncbi:MAG: hypothetical protein FJZ58_03300 [Chlamydiae bacterium]|nr:hypothetical protein [Chlamydiota bacterium]
MLLYPKTWKSGVKVIAEQGTADGAIDLVIELPRLIYVVEVKFNKSAKSALQQIQEKKYYQPFLQSGKKSSSWNWVCA